VLVNLTLPAASVPRPPGLLRALADLAVARSERYAEWAPVSWRVDGVPLTARAWRFAGGWAAYSEGPPGAYLGAAGLGIDPDGIAFAALPDGVAWNFDLAQAGPPRRQAHPQWHEDQLRLIREPGNGSQAS